MASSIPGFLLPRGTVSLRNQQRLLSNTFKAAHRSPNNWRHATSSAPSKPLTLEKPTKYNPPSHGKRAKQNVSPTFGPELSEEQRRVQQSKQYPHMMPPKGTFMFWFLTSRALHLTITMGVLVMLAGITTFENWKRKSPFKDQLPEREDLFIHPVRSFGMFLDAVKKTTNDNSARVAEMRQNEINDIQKQNTYRKAHRIQDKQGLGPWMPAEEVLRLHEQRASVPQEQKGPAVDIYRRKPVKKWLGIWE